VNTTINSIILPFVHAEGDDINASFDFAVQLKQEQAAHQKTRDALQHVQNEREIESVLREEHPTITAKAVADVTKLILQGDGGPLEQGKDGKLVEKYGTLQLPEFTRAYAKQNAYLLGTGNTQQSAPAALDRAKMSAKEKGQYIAKHGEEKYFALPCSPDPRQRKK
jgi:hypothetical protein